MACFASKLVKNWRNYPTAIEITAKPTYFQLPVCSDNQIAKTATIA
jgi:hypothetical protein